jgi:glucosamine 6-phosphate synthetase-like amidotransferase/phosphosugar isomerase protein
MCGIFGYYNYRISRDRKSILELLFTGLRRLEYRGYDSAGISIDADDLLQQAEVGQPGYGHANGSTNGTANGVCGNGAHEAIGRVFR